MSFFFLLDICDGFFARSVTFLLTNQEKGAILICESLNMAFLILYYFCVTSVPTGYIFLVAIVGVEPTIVSL